MHIIEPCCVQRQLSEVRRSLKNGGKEEIRGYGDMSLTELLPALLTSYNETELMIVAPTIPDQAAKIISKWAKWQWVRINGSKMYVLQRLTIISDLSEEHSPMASGWLKENPFGDRLTLIDKAQDDTAILLPDIAITGPLNLQYGRNFTCAVTTIQEEVGALWKQYNKQQRRQSKKRPAGTLAEPDTEADTDQTSAPAAEAESTAESVTTGASESALAPEAAENEQEV